MKKNLGIDLPTILASGFLAIAIIRLEEIHSAIRELFISIAGVRPAGSYYDDKIPLYFVLYLLIFAAISALLAFSISRIPDKYRKPITVLIILVGLFTPLI